MAKPKINKNVLFLGGAIVLGLIAAMLSVSYVQQRAATAEQAAAEAASRQRFEEVQVVVSRRDLQAGEIIRREDMVNRMVPVDFVPADPVNFANHERYIDRIVRGPIRRGAPISTSLLVEASRQFSRVIEPGRVAYSLSVNENNSISGMVAPGDRVDILLTFSGDRPTAGNMMVRTGERVAPLLENVLVLATGNKVNDLPGQEDRGYSSVTLELDPAQAEQLTVAQATGNIRVLLRNHEDQTPFGLDGLTERTLMATFTGGDSDTVEYIIGGSR